MQSGQNLTRSFVLTLAGFVACAGMSNTLVAQDTADSDKTAKIAATDVVSMRTKVAQAYQKLNTYNAEISIEIKPLEQPDAQPQFYSYVIAYDRNASALKVDRPELDVVIRKGKLQLLASDISERHLALDVAEPLKTMALFQQAPYLSQPTPYDLMMILGDAVIPENAIAIPASKDGDAGLGFTQENNQFAFHLDPNTNLINKIVQTVKHERGGQSMTLQFTYLYKVKSLDKPLDAKMFELALGDSKAVSNLKDLVGESAAANGETSLKGKVAPPFAVKDSKGNAVTLEGLQKKHRIVVLDFWATWCGPCRMTLPQLQQVYNWAASEKLSVGVYTVNQMETPEKAHSMWNEMKLSMPILMDADGKVSTTYGISAIPQLLVIIDGKVHSVHLGASPTTGADLKAELIELLKQS